MESRKRNEYMDAVRGLAALFVVWGHTFFYIGMWWIPDEIKSLGLLFEVPVFFMLSGWAASYRPTELKKTFRGLLRVLLQWIFFITVLAACCWLSGFTRWKLEGVSGIGDLLQNYTLSVSFPSLPVVQGSVWFLPLFFAVGILNPLVMFLLEKAKVLKKGRSVYLAVLIVGFLPLSALHLLPDFVQSIWFYAIFWMIGRNRESLRIDTAPKCILGMGAAVLGYLLSAHALGLPVLVVQDGKFPPTVAYGCWALFTMLPVFYLEGRIPVSRFLSHVGRQAIFYYFAQGVSTSLLCRLSDRITLFGVGKFPVLLALNLCLTTVIAEGLCMAWKRITWYNVGNFR